ncbi:hypothetical protein NL676_023658 [Syzygium grande]|nr:hypothetical protein NL676_023658 [Syzygium grande]
MPVSKEQAGPRRFGSNSSAGPERWLVVGRRQSDSSDRRPARRVSLGEPGRGETDGRVRECEDPRVVGKDSGAGGGHTTHERRQTCFVGDSGPRSWEATDAAVGNGEPRSEVSRLGGGGRGWGRHSPEAGAKRRARGDGPRSSEVADLVRGWGA